MELIKGQNISLSQKNETEKTKIIYSDITLIHPGRGFQASLGSYGGGSNKTLNNIYNHIKITEKNGKFFAKNPYGKNVFLPKEGIYGEGDNNIYFSEKDGEIVLVVEFSGKTEYYLENGEKYIPKTFNKKVLESLNSFNIVKKEVYMQISNILYTTEVKKIGDSIEKIKNQIFVSIDKILKYSIDKLSLEYIFNSNTPKSNKQEYQIFNKNIYKK